LLQKNCPLDFLNFFNMFPSLPAHANFFIFNRQASAMLALCRLKVIEEENSAYPTCKDAALKVLYYC